MVQFHAYPGGKKRVVTFSYDDGSANDERLIALSNKYGVKSTFHLNGINYINISDEEAARLREEARIAKEKELEDFFNGYGWKPYFVSGSDQFKMHEDMAKVMDKVIKEIKKVREKGEGKYPVIVVTTPKGWTGPKEVDDKKILNIEDIAIWNERFSDYIEELSNKGIPPVIEIKPNVMYQLGISPESEEYNILYYNKLKESIVNEIGYEPKPVYYEGYYLLLTNGTKVNIDKVIYDKLLEYVEE
jgi:peptidoglycan/xylan/chitin deacetylase (PgdA/CDA1 family)